MGQITWVARTQGSWEKPKGMSNVDRVCAASEPKLSGTVGPMSCHPFRTSRHTQGIWRSSSVASATHWGLGEMGMCPGKPLQLSRQRLSLPQAPFPEAWLKAHWQGRSMLAASKWTAAPPMPALPHARPSEPSPSGSGDTPGPTPPWPWCQCSLAQVGEGWFLSGVGLLRQTRHSGLLYVDIPSRHAPGCARDLSPDTP